MNKTEVIVKVILSMHSLRPNLNSHPVFFPPSGPLCLLEPTLLLRPSVLVLIYYS